MYIYINKTNYIQASLRAEPSSVRFFQQENHQHMARQTAQCLRLANDTYLGVPHKKILMQTMPDPDKTESL